MREELENKVCEIAQAMIDEGENVKLGELIMNMMYSSKISESDLESFIDCVDNLDDTIVPLLHAIFDEEKFFPWYRTILFLFEENIRFLAETQYDEYETCGDVIFSAICSGISEDELKDILNNSADQEEFVKGLYEYIHPIMLKEDYPEKETKQNASPVENEVGVSREFIEHLKNENLQLTNQIHSLKDEIQNYVEKSKKDFEEIVCLKAAASNQERELEYNHRALEKTQTNVILFEKKYENAKRMLDLEKAVSQELLEASKNVPDPESIERIKELNVAKEENRKLRVDAETLRNEVESLRKTEETLKEENSDLQMEKESLTAEVERLNAKIAALNEDIQALQKESEMPRAEIKENRAVVASEDHISASETIPEPLFVAEPEFDAGSEFTKSILNDEPDEDLDNGHLQRIQEDKESVFKISKIFSQILSEHFEKKFEKKPQVDQSNQIYIKVMENGYDQSVLAEVGKLLKGNYSFSRLELYRLVSNKAPKEHILQFCKMIA
ncbi:hypothetical protein ACTQ56_00710 [[Clostridium] aminophilum]|uniref:hypothetical protein n=1 Tax=[Clostridium] aminophilum TaxID=1526 RepID=UPI003F94C7A5